MRKRFSHRAAGIRFLRRVEQIETERSRVTSDTALDGDLQSPLHSN